MTPRRPTLAVLAALAHAGLALTLAGAPPPARAIDLHGFGGHWRAPDQSVIEIRACPDGKSLCGHLVQARTYGSDEFNPDPGLRKRPICGLLVLSLQSFADGVWRNGSVYNPEDGKTYRAALRRRDGSLFLRAYIGSELFGETETWTAVSDFKAGCSA